MSTLRASGRVLPTLNADGTRRWIQPRLFRGRYYRARRIAAIALMVVFGALPFLRVGEKPAVLLDVRRWEFTLFGKTFFPTDGVLLMLLMLSIFVAIIFLTALIGRAWCGWGCPQTVYMEFLFRPIERFFEGGGTGKKAPRRGARVLKNVVFLGLSAVLGNVFLAYFVGTDALFRWMSGSPSEHPSAFLMMAVTTGLVFWDFAYFREQMCTVICPYARLQSALLDQRSLVVAYDAARGEPRGKKGKVTGDCVDCKLCVVACPTGIDIRNGLQLECIACTQCIDACDPVMAKLGRPPGLIRYTSEQALAKKRPFDLRAFLRPRTIAYAVVLAVLLTALGVFGAGRSTADIAVLRGLGAPFVVEGNVVRNHVRLKVRNRGRSAASYSLSVAGASDVSLVAPENPLEIAPDEQKTATLFVLAPRETFHGGRRTVRLVLKERAGFEKVVDYQLLGPEGNAS